MSAPLETEPPLARFRVGDRISVRRAYPPGHIRTPWYIRGCVGIVDVLYGSFRNPEELAFGRPGLPPQPLYRVRFQQTAIWPDYAGARHDTICLDLYQHWLEPA